MMAKSPLNLSERQNQVLKRCLRKCYLQLLQVSIGADGGLYMHTHRKLYATRLAHTVTYDLHTTTRLKLKLLVNVH